MKIEEIVYQGKGNHSVHNLEKIIEQLLEKNSALQISKQTIQESNKELLSKIEELEKELETLRGDAESSWADLATRLNESQQMNERLVEGIRKIVEGNVNLPVSHFILDLNALLQSTTQEKG